MFSVRVLGGFALDGPNGSQVRRISQRRAEAVLAVLSVAGDLGCARERLVALLWQESDEDRGRHSLRDALHAIRQVLGPEAIQNGAGETLRLAPAIVASDVQRFQQALALTPPTEAVELYRGPLLDGFHIDNAPEFERWQDAERSRLFGRFEAAIATLAGEAEQAEHWREAAQWWARSLEQDPFNTRVVVRRMWALARAGDRPNAIKQGETHRRRLLEDLDLEPDPAFIWELDRVRSGDFGPPQFLTPADRRVMPAPRAAEPDG